MLRLFSRCQTSEVIRCVSRGRVYSSKSKDPESTIEEASPKQQKEQPRRTPAEQDEALMAAYKEKFGGDITAQFENGQATEMKRSVRSNMFRCMDGRASFSSAYANGNRYLMSCRELVVELTRNIAWL